MAKVLEYDSENLGSDPHFGMKPVILPWSNLHHRQLFE